MAWGGGTLSWCKGLPTILRDMRTYGGSNPLHTDVFRLGFAAKDSGFEAKMVTFRPRLVTVEHGMVVSILRKLVYGLGWVTLSPDAFSASFKW